MGEACGFHDVPNRALDVSRVKMKLNSITLSVKGHGVSLCY